MGKIHLIDTQDTDRKAFSVIIFYSIMKVLLCLAICCFQLNFGYEPGNAMSLPGGEDAPEMTNAKLERARADTRLAESFMCGIICSGECRCTRKCPCTKEEEIALLLEKQQRGMHPWKPLGN